MVHDHFEAADDAELVLAIGHGDNAAMAEILRRHRDPVLAFARRLVGDHSRAEEITQDVFIRLWQVSGRFDAKRGALRAFLLALTHGRALDVIRSDSARFRREERDVARSPDLSQDPGEQVVARTVAGAVRSALSLLPESERRAVELAYFEGHSYRTVAAMLNEPEGTVKSRIRNGLARLRSVLEAHDVHGS